MDENKGTEVKTSAEWTRAMKRQASEERARYEDRWYRPINRNVNGDTPMLNITEFLEARIAEDEDRARYIQEYGDTGGMFRPARILAECAAKRAIIDMHQTYATDVTESVGIAQIGARCGQEATHGALKSLAAVYSAHPDYQQEWAL